MNNSLSFPEIKIIRKNTKFTTSVFSQPTLNEVFANYESAILNFIPNFKLFHQKIQNLKIIFRKNGHRVSFTDLYIKKYLPSLTKYLAKSEKKNHANLARTGKL